MSQPEPAVVISDPTIVIYEGGWHYKGYHGTPSVCVLRLYQPIKSSGQPRAEDGALDNPETLPHAVALFTEAYNNEGTSVTNKIEALATSAWEYLGKPEKPPVVIENYPNRGVYNSVRDKWQFPESFDIVEFDRKPDGSFEKPRWRRVGRATAEELIGQPIT
nr:hypothetical protein [Armatimonas sp.]